jgi:hypothetical protein
MNKLILCGKPFVPVPSLVAVERFTTLDDMRSIVGPKNPPFFANLHVGKCTHVAAFVGFTLRKSQGLLPRRQEFDISYAQEPGQDVAIMATVDQYVDKPTTNHDDCECDPDRKRYLVTRFEVLLHKTADKVELFYCLDWNNIRWKAGRKQRAIGLQIHLSRFIGGKACHVRFYRKESDPKHAIDLMTQTDNLLFKGST